MSVYTRTIPFKEAAPAALVLAAVYPDEERARKRALRAARGLSDRFGGGPCRLFCAPGRTELGGNHTDHNRGLALAAAVDADILAAARRTDQPVIRLHSEGYYTDVIELDDLSPQERETSHSAALIRGIAAGFRRRGLLIGGFDAYTTSEVPRGAGVSSSAAFEITVAEILNGLYNRGEAGPALLARIAQEAENDYFGKPCGRLDQTASAFGGCVALDFENPDEPLVRRLPADCEGWGLRLCIVDTGGSHSDLTQDYAACRLEMEEIARLLGGEVLRDIPRERFETALPALRRRAGDRAVLRAMHFYEENERVRRQCAALEAGDAAAFLRLVAASGRSSQALLQNVSSPQSPREQGIALALALTGELLGEDGAWRVHGGGFAGTIQAYVPEERLPFYRRRMERVFGEGCCHVLAMRETGGTELIWG